MSDGASIKINKDGPLAIKGVTSITDADGNPLAAKETMFLCRCGHSANKPFCDGSHSREGWTAG